MFSLLQGPIDNTDFQTTKANTRRSQSRSTGAANLEGNERTTFEFLLSSRFSYVSKERSSISEEGGSDDTGLAPE